MHVEPPAPPALPTQNVEVPLIPVPQTFSVENGQLSGEAVAIVTFTSPLSTMIVVLGRDSALKLAEELRASFSDIEVARVSALKVVTSADQAARRG